MKKGMNILSDEEQEDIMDMLEHRYENWCSGCIFFKTEECQHLDEVFESTRWKDIGCKKFWD